MSATDPQWTADQVLQIFRNDQPYLFLGAAFTTLGLISLAFALLRRKFDAMLFWLALFAILYGIRLWLQLGITALLASQSLSYYTLRAASNYLVPIPAFFYFQTAGFLNRFGRFGPKIATILAIPFVCLFALTFLNGPVHLYDQINSVIVILSLIILFVESIRRKAIDPDFAIVRVGILIFGAFALYDNVESYLGVNQRDEPYGFAIFLAILGYVAAKRAVARDHQLSELQKELEIARRIQTDILPSAYPNCTNFCVAARYIPMTAVAGDLYDFVLTKHDKTGLLIADVSGHGIPAALIASMVKLAASAQQPNAADPAALLAGMNTVLHGNTQSQFVTAAYVYLDAASSTLRYSAAGHPPMLLLRDGEITPIEQNGLMLAAFSFATYETSTHPLQPGDRLFLYTDGLLEAADLNGEEFGPDRLASLLKASALLTADKAADEIVATLQNWSRSQTDDLTVLICDFQNPFAATS
jgi:sigma-B regulation protein RsbU (phosphoserine phosphatase)